MQVALLSEVLHGPPAADDAPRSAGAQSSGRPGDFAAVLAERQESASAIEKDVRVHDRAPTASRSSPDEPQVRAVRDVEDEPRVVETERNRAVSDEANSSPDSNEVVETAWLAFSGMNQTAQIVKGEDATASESGIIATVAGAASKGGGAVQVAPVELGLDVARPVAVPAPGVVALSSEEIANSRASGARVAWSVAALSSEEIANQFVLAMADLTDGADEGAPGLMRTLTVSLQENKANVQNTLQPILITGSPAVTDVSNALPPALSQDTVDLGAWLKKLALALYEEPSRNVSGEAALQPLQTEPLKSASGGKDADGVDPRLLVSAAQNQDSVASKASPVSPANAPESVTPAVLDKLVLQSVRYLVSRGEKSVTVQLSPPSLGELRIEVSSVKNVLNVSLLSGNPGVRDVLESHVLGLREALARSGIEVTHVAVLPALAGHAAGQQYAGQAQPDFTRMAPAVRFGAMQPAESGQTFDALYRRVAPHDGTLNLFI